MTSRDRRTWGVFAACLALVGLALGWATREVLELERREAKAIEDARVHESMRLALWRMDSAFAPVLAQEALKGAADEPVLAAANAAANAGLLAPADAPPRAFRRHFTIDAAGNVTHADLMPFVPHLKPPAAPAREEQKRADAGEKKAQKEKDSIDARSFRKAELDDMPESRAADKAVDALVVPLTLPPMPKPVDRDRSVGKVDAPAANPEPAEQVQVEHAPRQQKDEYQERAKLAQQFQMGAQQTLQIGNEFFEANSTGTRLNWIPSEAGPLEAKWLATPGGGYELFFVRKVRNKLTKQETVQGLWCDWPNLERWLVSAVRDLFPAAHLVPAPDPKAGDEAALLATIPARLVPGPPAHAGPRPSSPTRLVLAAAWIAALGAIAAVGGVLKAAMSLGERRGRFVSAVTHELRTPLTTFRMYSQMLADGMVPPDARPEYLATLRDESERLARVVESVLLYSRLEEGRGGAHRERLPARALVDRILPPVSKRAADGGMALATVIEVDPAAAVELDVQAVEQIVLNLVDNACKYAAPEGDRLELSFRTEGATLRVRCRDFGPGIPAEERDAVFLPFRRGSKDAAGTTPGVGLGLALARGLARALGGDLVLDPSAPPGACFEVAIPMVR
jgi:signal transduction histidine kinase